MYYPTTIDELINLLQQAKKVLDGKGNSHVHIYNDEQLILHLPEKTSSGDAYIFIKKSE